jgi:hypothetical protein
VPSPRSTESPQTRTRRVAHVSDPKSQFSEAEPCVSSRLCLPLYLSDPPPTAHRDLGRRGHGALRRGGAPSAPTVPREPHRLTSRNPPPNHRQYLQLSCRFLTSAYTAAGVGDVERRNPNVQPVLRPDVDAPVSPPLQPSDTLDDDKDDEDYEFDPLFSETTGGARSSAGGSRGACRGSARGGSASCSGVERARRWVRAGGAWRAGRLERRVVGRSASSVHGRAGRGFTRARS